MRSLLMLTINIGIDYKHAWHALGALERAGLVTVERRRGHPLVISSKPSEAQEAQEAQLLQQLQIAESLTVRGLGGYCSDHPISNKQ